MPCPVSQILQFSAENSTHRYSTRVFGEFPLDQIEVLGLGGGRPWANYSSNYLRTNPTYTTTVYQRHRRTDGHTDGRTDGRLMIAIPRFALRASRSKNRRSTCEVSGESWWKQDDGQWCRHARHYTECVQLLITGQWEWQASIHSTYPPAVLYLCFNSSPVITRDFIRNVSHHYNVMMCWHYNTIQYNTITFNVAQQPCAQNTKTKKYTKNLSELEPN